MTEIDSHFSKAIPLVVRMQGPNGPFTAEAQLHYEEKLEQAAASLKAAREGREDSTKAIQDMIFTINRTDLVDEYWIPACDSLYHRWADSGWPVSGEWIQWVKALNDLAGTLPDLITPCIVGEFFTETVYRHLRLKVAALDDILDTAFDKFPNRFGRRNGLGLAINVQVYVISPSLFEVNLNPRLDSKAANGIHPGYIDRTGYSDDKTSLKASTLMFQSLILYLFSNSS